MTHHDHHRHGIGRRPLVKTAALGLLGAGFWTQSGAATAAQQVDYVPPSVITLDAESDRVEYRIRVSGNLTRGRYGDANDDVQAGGIVDGRLTSRDDRDSFRFSGEVTEFEIADGDASVSVNGERVNDPVGHPELPRSIVLRAVSDSVEYDLRVSGDLQMGGFGGPNESIEGGDSVSGVLDREGAVDSFLFSGEVTEFEITDGDATVWVNDARVDDPTRATDPSADGNAVTLRPLTDRAEYRVSADGPIRFGDEAGDGDEMVDGDAVEGALEGDEADDYELSGDDLVVEVTSGVLAFTVSREEADDPAEDDLPHAITVSGLGGDVNYRFSVTGTVEFGEGAETTDTDLPADELSGDDTVEGWVHAHGDTPFSDDYRYSGTVEFERAEAPVEIEISRNA
ncbi:hypothetical protein G9464_14700 [Halostella sp. JP-L12]|uniref:hypothetical protein n=1 Tax=Halostella TaxID=1843185 RepID=UPI0013CE79CA|nr:MULTISPECIES: hypothetical protein [Halostella]NHN48836.1 hypothetical protein [Halostella sp. JP-L12]